ncbi:MAG: hypothetical protein PHY58_01625, partial [Bacteroidales bacterium]|nr:hypothetical protein [Bacteroidales bacterium]
SRARGAGRKETLHPYSTTSFSAVRGAQGAGKRCIPTPQQAFQQGAGRRAQGNAASLLHNKLLC